MDAREAMKDSLKYTVLSAVVGGGIGILLFLAPILIWLGWNVLGVGDAVGIGDLSLAGILLAWVFCWAGALFRAAMVGLVFIIEPDWFIQGTAGSAHFPDPSWSVWFGILFLLVAFLPISDDN